MSNALEDLGHDLTDPLWTARVLRDAPEAVAEVHRRYYRAGGARRDDGQLPGQRPRLRRPGALPIEAAALVVRSVALAREVRDELADDGVERWVAASVGPYGAVLADGSEYRGRYGVSAARLRDFHGPRLELLASAGPDLLAVETIPDLEEAEVLADLLSDVGLPTWFSFSAREVERRGQPLAEAFATAAAPTTVVAVGVNCCPADEVLDAVRLAVATGKKAVAYPNGGASGTHGRGPGLEWRMSTRTSRSWVSAGAAYVGGCCRVGPARIARLAWLSTRTRTRPDRAGRARSRSDLARAGSAPRIVTACRARVSHGQLEHVGAVVVADGVEKRRPDATARSISAAISPRGAAVRRRSRRSGCRSRCCRARPTPPRRPRGHARPGHGRVGGNLVDPRVDPMN